MIYRDSRLKFALSSTINIMIVLLLFNKTNMFLQNILNELKDDQVWYAWVSTLVELEKNDLDTKEWRMKFIIDVLKLSNSFGYKFFRDCNQLADLLQVKQDFATAKSYHANKTVVWGKLKNIIESISYEIRKENEWNECNTCGGEEETIILIEIDKKKEFYSFFCLLYIKFS